MGQNILLKCAEIGIGVCPVSGFVDDTLKEILRLYNQEVLAPEIGKGGSLKRWLLCGLEGGF